MAKLPKHPAEEHHHAAAAHHHHQAEHHHSMGEHEDAKHHATAAHDTVSWLTNTPRRHIHTLTNNDPTYTVFAAPT